MTFDEFLRRVEQSRAKNPIWFALDSDTRAEEDEIITAERQLGVIFPEEYKLFIRAFGGGFFAFCNVFSVKPDSKWYIVSKNGGANVSAGGFLSISDNGVGDSYGFMVRDRVCSSEIAFSDHETGGISVVYCDLFEYISAIGLRMNEP